MKKKYIIILAFIISIVIFFIISLIIPKETVSMDSKKFRSEYKEVSKNNVFVYSTSEEIINILKNGTGIIYFGYKESLWCQKYVKYLNEVAIDMGVNKIYYYDFLNDKEKNTNAYQQIVSILDNYLKDDEKDKQIYAPITVTVKKGEIVGFDDDVAWDLENYQELDKYWNSDNISSIKDKLETMISNANINMCTEECK